MLTQMSSGSCEHVSSINFHQQGLSKMLFQLENGKPGILQAADFQAGSTPIHTPKGKFSSMQRHPQLVGQLAQRCLHPAPEGQSSLGNLDPTGGLLSRSILSWKLA